MRYGPQLILEYGCQLQLSLLSNYKQTKEDCLQVKRYFATNFHCSFKLLHRFHLIGLAWNHDGRDLWNKFAIFSSINTASLTLTLNWRGITRFITPGWATPISKRPLECCWNLCAMTWVSHRPFGVDIRRFRLSNHPKIGPSQTHRLIKHTTLFTHKFCSWFAESYHLVI